jgi:hypothetical protein
MKKSKNQESIILTRGELRKIAGGVAKSNFGKPPVPMNLGLGQSVGLFSGCYKCCWSYDLTNCSAAVAVPSNSTCTTGAVLVSADCPPVKAT